MKPGEGPVFQHKRISSPLTRAIYRMIKGPLVYDNSPEKHRERARVDEAGWPVRENAATEECG